jgi:hypothetical protein
MPRQNLLTWQPATRHQLVTWRVHGTLANGATRGPQLARTPISFFFFPPIFSPPIPRQVCPLRQHLPSPLLPHFLLLRLSSLTILQSFSTLPNHQQQEALACLLLCSPIRRPSRSPSSLSSPLLRRTPTPSAIASGRRAPPPPPQSHSPLSGPVSLHLRYAFKSFYCMNNIFILIFLLDWVVIFVWFLRNFD